MKLIFFSSLVFMLILFVTVFLVQVSSSQALETRDPFAPFTLEPDPAQTLQPLLGPGVGPGRCTEVQKLACSDEQTCREIHEASKFFDFDESNDNTIWVPIDINGNGAKYDYSQVYCEELNTNLGLNSDEIGLPLGSTYLTSCWGLRTLNNNPDCHDGLDFDGDSGDPIYAVADGVVTDTDNTQSSSTTGCGNKVKIRHSINGEEIHSLYCHLSSVSITSGVRVSKGEKIGEVGNTGASGGNHLHLSFHSTGNFGGDRGISPLCVYDRFGIDLQSINNGDKQCSSYSNTCSGIFSQFKGAKEIGEGVCN